MLGAGDAVEQAVEVGGFQDLALGQGEAYGFHDLAQGIELLWARLLVDAVEQAQALGLQGLGGGDVGQDHEVLDHAVGVEALAEGDRQHLALVGEDDAALGEIEVQRLAQVAGAVGGGPRGPERADDGIEEGRGGWVRVAVGGGLGLAVGEGGGGAHQGAGEAVVALVAVGVEDDPDGDAGAVGAVDQRAEIGREPLGQHRHDAVGEIGGVAAAAGLAVERRAGADVGRDVGDRHPDDVAARVRRVVVGMGADGIVVVAGVGGVDGDQRQGAQVFAVAERNRAGGFGLGQHGVREGVGDAVLVDGDQRDRLRGRGIAQAGDDAGAGQAVAAGLADLVGLDQFTVAGAAAVAGADLPVAVAALVDGGDAAAGFALVIDADHPLRPHADAADDARGERGVRAVEHGHPAEQAVAGAERRVVAAGEDADPRHLAAVALGGLGPEVAVAVGAGDPEHQHRRQGALGADLAAALLELALVGHPGEQLFQLDLGGALQTEGAGDLALAGLGRVLAQEGEDLVGRRQAVHPPHLARGRRRRHGKNSPGRGGSETTQSGASTRARSAASAPGTPSARRAAATTGSQAMMSSRLLPVAAA